MIAAVDGEWPSSFFQTSDSLALFQIGVAQVCYLVDVVTLSSTPAASLSSFFLKFFSDERVFKLGFAVGHDIGKVRDAIKAPLVCASVVDLHTLGMCVWGGGGGGGV